VKYGLYAFFAVVPCLRKKGVQENGEGFNTAFKGKEVLYCGFMIVKVSFASCPLPSGGDLLVLTPSFVLTLEALAFSGLILELFVGVFVG
jgi:hypothetical protein